MDGIAILFSIFPILFFLIYFIFIIAIMGGLIWIVIMFLRRQKERNEALERIANRLEAMAPTFENVTNEVHSDSTHSD